MKSLVIKLFNMLLKNPFFYWVCKKYTDLYNNENNCDMHTNGELRFMKDKIKKDDVVFDVGAHTGGWAKCVLSISPDIKLHCFEPGGSAFQKLLGNAFGPNVRCNRLGLGARNEKGKLFTFNEGSRLNSLYRRRIAKGGGRIKTQCESEVVELATLDGYCRRNNIEKIDFLKIDVEGNELEVLKGASDLLKKEKIEIIQFEYGGSFIDASIFLKDVFDFFNDLNYKIFKIFPNGLRLIEGYDHELENFRYANYAAIRNGRGSL